MQCIFCIEAFPFILSKIQFFHKQQTKLMLLPLFSVTMKPFPKVAEPSFLIVKCWKGKLFLKSVKLLEQKNDTNEH